MRTLATILAEIFDMRPRPTGNPDLDEVLLYNYLATVCDLCGAKPAHGHAGVRHCDACCQRDARERIAAAEAGPAGPPS